MFCNATQCIIIEDGLSLVIYSLTKGEFISRGSNVLEVKALLEALSVLEWEVI